MIYLVVYFRYLRSLGGGLRATQKCCKVKFYLVQFGSARKHPFPVDIQPGSAKEKKKKKLHYLMDFLFVCFKSLFSNQHK